jgi:hypothetical protein
MPDYSNGKIYKIVCNITGDIYIGSTCEPILARRLAGHVSKYKSYLNGKSAYVTSFEIIEQGNYDIVLIELFPCDTKDQLHARESHYTQTIQCVNKIKNQGLIIKIGKTSYDKQYNVDHKDRKKEYFKQYNEQRKEQQKQYREQRKEQQKQYRLYYDIRRGLDMIKKLDNYFINK